MLYVDMFSAFSRLFHSFACFPSAKKNHPENGIDANSHNFSTRKRYGSSQRYFKIFPNTGKDGRAQHRLTVCEFSTP